MQSSIFIFNEHKLLKLHINKKLRIKYDIQIPKIYRKTFSMQFVGYQ